VAVIRTEPLELAEVIPVEKAPTHIYLSPDGTTIWVPNDGSASVTAIDVATHKVLAHVPTDAGHHKIAFTPDGRFIYVSNMIAGNVSVVDAVKKAFIKSIPTGQGVHGIDYCPATHEVIACNSGESTLSVIDVAKNEEVAKFPFGKRPALIHFDAHNPNTGYVVSRADHSVWVLDVGKRQMVARIPVDRQPDKFVVEPSHRWMYVSAPASFSVVDLQSYQKVGSVPLAPLAGANSAAASPAGSSTNDMAGMDHEGMDHEEMEKKGAAAAAAPQSPPANPPAQPGTVHTGALVLGVGLFGLSLVALRKFHRNRMAALLFGLSLVAFGVWRASGPAPAESKGKGLKAIASESESIMIHSYLELSDDGKHIYVPVSAQNAAYVIDAESHQVLARVPLQGGAENIFYLK
ncbi:MAG: YncE family protein, partial [Acidobacteria bacterium]|nr:YncE family protein [Acidobacteriota bacterium]